MRLLKLKYMFALLALLANSAYATTLPEMAISFSNSYAGIWKFMTGATTVIGVLLISGSIFAWVKTMEEQSRTRTSIKVPMSMFIIGIILFQIGDALKTVEDSFSMTANSLLTSSAGAGSAGAIVAVLGFVQILGFIAFVRGWLVLHKFNTGDARDGLGRAMTHIAGGAAAINIKWTIGMLAATFAPDMVGTLSGLGMM